MCTFYIYIYNSIHNASALVDSAHPSRLGEIRFQLYGAARADLLIAQHLTHLTPEPGENSMALRTSKGANDANDANVHG